jgi:hypothetical protein
MKSFGNPQKMMFMFPVLEDGFFLPKKLLQYLSNQKYFRENQHPPSILETKK